MANINLQMYSFMDGTMNDTRENLKAAAEMGYDGVELFGPNLEISAAEMKALLAENGLTAVSLHAPTEQILNLISYAEQLGMNFIGIAMETMLNDEAVYAFAEKLNQLGKSCNERGIMLTYHNHTQEFGSCGEKTIIGVLMDQTNPEYVSFELDAGWCAAAGFDPIAFIKQYSGRVKLVHIKESGEVLGIQPFMDFDAIEMDENGFPKFTPEMLAQMDRAKKINCAAGAGLVDWKKLKETADAHGCRAYIVEREHSYAGSRLECLKADIDYYKTVM